MHYFSDKSLTQQTFKEGPTYWREMVRKRDEAWMLKVKLDQLYAKYDQDDVPFV